MIRRLYGHGGYITSIFVDEGRIYSGSEDRTLRFWDLIVSVKNLVMNLPVHQTGDLYYQHIDNSDLPSSTKALKQERSINNVQNILVHQNKLLFTSNNTIHIWGKLVCICYF